MIHKEPLFTSLTSYEKQTLLEQKDDLSRKLGEIADRLTIIESQHEQQTPPVTMKISVSRSEYHDSGYTDGYSEVKRETFIVTSQDIQVAYLAVLASQSDPVAYYSNGPSEGSGVYVHGIQYNSNSFEQPPKNFADQFKETMHETIELVKELTNESWKNNPYEGIPIKINKRALADTLLRLEILRYCRHVDPDFTITETTKK